MTLQELFVEFTKDNIKIIKLDLIKELKGGYLCDTNKKCIVFINSNITNEEILKHFLRLILDHIRHCTSLPDEFYYPFTKL